MLAKRKVAGLVDDGEKSPALVAGEHVVEPDAAIDHRRAVVESPNHLHRALQASLVQPLQRLALFARELREEKLGAELLRAHLVHALLVLRNREREHDGVYPFVGDDVGIEAVVLVHPAHAFRRPGRIRRLGEHDFVGADPGAQRAAIHHGERLHEIVVLEREPCRGVTAARMADEVHGRQLQRADERPGMPNDGRHRVVVVLRIVGFALPGLVEHDGAKVLREGEPGLAPRVPAGAGIARAEVAAVDEDDRLALPRLVIAGADAVDVQPFAFGQSHYFAVAGASSCGTPSVFQSVLFGTRPSNDASCACAMRSLPAPITAPVCWNFFTADSIMRRNWTTAMSLEPGWSLLRSAIEPIDSHIAMSCVGMPLIPVKSPSFIACRSCSYRLASVRFLVKSGLRSSPTVAAQNLRHASCEMPFCGSGCQAIQ